LEVDSVIDSMTDSKPGSARDFVDHWDWTAARGLMPKDTANSLRVATSTILETAEGQGWESLDVRQLNVDDVLDRFARLAAKRYNPRSLATYQSRFRRALQLYDSFLENPAGYRPPTRNVRRDRARGAPAPKKPEQTPEQPLADPVLGSTQTNATFSGPTNTNLPYIDVAKYPFPLRPGFFAQLHLPADLQKSEAQRLCAFINSLAVDPPASTATPTTGEAS
jgi:hypothetical protein